MEENKLNKLKNKKKDIIAVEKNIEKSNVDINVGNDKDVKNENLNEKVENVDSSENNTLINKILFRIQLLFSMTNKLDSKLLTLFSQFISQEHLKGILEERDCRGICGNLLCGDNIDKNKHQQYFYNENVKDFSKENLLQFFCNIKCYQKFKDISLVSQKFDYFRLLNLENIYLFYIINQYYPKNKYLDEISQFADLIIKKEKRVIKNPQILINFKSRIDKYFVTNEEVKNLPEEGGLDNLFEKLEIINK